MSIRFTHVPATNRSCAAGSGEASFFFDPAAALDRLRLVEHAGFHGFVIDDVAGILTNMDIAAQATHPASSLEIVLTHAAGVLAPVVAARQIAALDEASGGRIALRVVADGALSSGEAQEQPPSHAAAFARLDEYLVLLKRLWSNEAPFEHQGPFYSIREGHVPRKGPQGAAIPVRMGGLSGTAIRVAARHADIFELEPGSPEEVRALVARVVSVAREFGRAERIRFALPVDLSQPASAASPCAGSVRLSGSPAEIVLRLLPYAAIGVTEFMVSGVATPRDIELFGRETGPLLSNSIRRRVAPEPVAPPAAAAIPAFGERRHN